MVTEDDCSCTDTTTEPSNATSLRSDDVVSVPDADVGTVCVETVEKEDHADEELKNTDCECPEASPPPQSPVMSYCVSATAVAASVVPVTKPEHKSQQTKSRSQPASGQLQASYPCLCHSHKINGYVVPVKVKEGKPQSGRFWSRLTWKRPKNGYFGKSKMYEIKLKQVQCPHYAKTRLNGAREQRLLGAPQSVCEFQPVLCPNVDASKGIPSRDAKYDPDKARPPKQAAKMKPRREKDVEKIEIYYFDHGSSAYYRTTDCHPVLTTDRCAEKTDQAAIRFWAEIFGTIHIGTAFVTAFILQLLRFVLYSVIRPLTVGILQLIADYLVKPLLSIFFNAVVQPVLILLYNILTSLRDLCEPIAEALGLFLREIANLCAAIRIVEVKHVHHAPPTACT